MLFAVAIVAGVVLFVVSFILLLTWIEFLSNGIRIQSNHVWVEWSKDNTINDEHYQLAKQQYISDFIGWIIIWLVIGKCWFNLVQFFING